MYGDPSAKRLLGGLVGAIDLSRFGSPNNFRHRISELMARRNAQERGQADVSVLYPGHPEQTTRNERLKNGIPVGVNLITIFSALSKERGVPWSFSES